MDSGKTPIVFFGSGPVAFKSLEFLNDNFDIELVITKPRSGRRDSTNLIPDFCDKFGLEWRSGSTAKQVQDAISANQPSSRVGIVVDFGVIIGSQTIDYFELGIINSHFSVLPQWRGADPIAFTILSGQKETGVSLMRIVPALDEGPLISVKKVPVQPNWTTPNLTEKLIKVSNSLLLEELPKYISGKLQPYEQDTSQNATYSRKLLKSDAVIDWTKDADQIEREIRAFIDWPKSRTVIKSMNVTIKKAHVSVVGELADESRPGEIAISKSTITITCGKGHLTIDELQPDGKKAMPSASFINGYLR